MPAFLPPPALPLSNLSPSSLSSARSKMVSQSPLPRRRRAHPKGGGLSPGLLLSRRAARPPQTLSATWCNTTLAVSSEAEFIDGRFYFPRASVDWSLLADADERRNHNPIGPAQYYDIVVPGSGRGGVRRNKAAAWAFGPLRKQWRVLEGFTTFWKGVKIQVVNAEENGEDGSGGDGK